MRRIFYWALQSFAPAILLFLAALILFITSVYIESREEWESESEIIARYDSDVCESNLAGGEIVIRCTNDDA